MILHRNLNERLRSRPHLVGFFALIFCYLPVLTSHNPVNPDAQFILPNLRQMEGVWDYFQKLFRLQTIDIQPIRDISLYVDIGIYELTGWNSLVFQNLLLWFSSSLYLKKILQKTFPDLAEGKTNFILLCFLVFPLFSQTLCWGMARKHILAFLFTTLATKRWLNHRRGVTVFYTLAVLSQPIALLWPLWAIFDDHKRFKVLIPSFVVMITVTVSNYIYYQQSPVFAALFGTKTNEVANLPEMILAIGHYLFQLIFPFFLSSKYVLGHWTQLAGLLFLIMFGWVLYRSVASKKFLLSWALFSFLPLSIILLKPSFLFDTYLLIPAIGVLILIIALVQNLKFQIPKGTGFFLISIFGAFTFYSATFWRDEISLARQSFERRPDCASAFLYLRISYENGIRPDSPSARRYLYEHKCERMVTFPGHLDQLKASLLFYEDDLPLPKRISHLKDLSTRGIYPQMAYIALLLKTKNMEEARKEIDKMTTQWRGVKFKEELIPIAGKVILPFCEETQNQTCVEMMKPFLRKPSAMQFR